MNWLNKDRRAVGQTGGRTDGRTDRQAGMRAYTHGPAAVLALFFLHGGPPLPAYALFPKYTWYRGLACYLGTPQGGSAGLSGRSRGSLGDAGVMRCKERSRMHQSRGSGAVHVLRCGHFCGNIILYHDSMIKLRNRVSKYDSIL